MTVNRRMENLCLLCGCLSPFVKGEALRGQLQIADWERIVALANSYFLAPALWAGLDLKGLSADIDPQLAGYLEAVFHLNAERNQALLRQVEELAAALNAAGIEPLLLKGGAALASGVFPRLGERFMVDLDVWVGEEKIDAAEQVLFALGYRRQAQSASFPITDLSQHRPRLQKPDAPASVELHTRLLKSRVLSAALNERIASAASLRLSNGARVRVLEPTGQVLHTLLHSQVSHCYHRNRYIELRYLYNFVALCRAHAAEIDWAAIAALMGTHGHARVLETYLLLAGRLFGLPSSADLAPRWSARWCAAAALLPYRIGIRPVRAVLRCQRLSTRFLRLLLAALSRETITHRYPTHNSRHVWMNRLRHIGYLLRKYRDPGARRLRLEQLAHSCRDWA